MTTFHRRRNTSAWNHHPLPVQKIVAILLFSIAGLVHAQAASAIRQISWSPKVLAVGSPCIFSVQLDKPAQRVKGQWAGRNLDFVRAAGGNTWFSLAGIDVESAPGQRTLSLDVSLASGEILKETRVIEILPASYKTIALSVEGKYIEPDAATLARVADEKKLKEEAFAHRIDQVEWQGNFIAPVLAPPTDSFGTRRVFNGKTASVHRGLDFRARTGTQIVASNSGEVVLAQNMFYEGGFVIIDHGLQFTTMYMHMSKIIVSVGDHVSKGQPIGLSGASGRVTGPHLHMAVRWQGEALDPLKLFRLSLPVPANN